MKPVLLSCLLFVFVSGCVIPLAPKHSYGHRFSKEELAFLKAPDVTRDEVVATLGEPVIEVRDPGVLLYVWEMTDQEYFMAPEITYKKTDIKPFGDSRVVDGDIFEVGLLIAYDKTGRVISHEIRDVDMSNLQDAAIWWRQGRAD